MSRQDVGTLSISALRSAYRAGRFTPVDVVDAVYARIADRADDAGQDPVWITLVPHEQARDVAAALDPADLDRLPLWGIPFAVKDNIDTAGIRTTAACPDFAYVPLRSAAAVDRLVDSGALLIGKTNLDQFATGLNGTRSPYGIPRNAVDPAYIPGGSSSGSAVAVAAGLVSVALGTDTAGSGRVPAALNGIVGHKPSVGLISASGVVPACRSLDCPSVFSLDVADAAAVTAVLAGFDAADPWSRRLPPPPPVPGSWPPDGLRLAVPAMITGWGALGEERAWTALLDRLVGVGVDLVPVDADALLAAGTELYGGAWTAERLDGLESWVDDHPASLHPVTRELLARGKGVRGVDVFAALSRMQGRRQATRDLLAGVDALLTPTVTGTFTIEQMLADPIERNARLGTWTTFTNLLDLCATAIPAGTLEHGLPFGVSIQAPAGQDARVLAIASAVEELLAGRTPTGTAVAEALDLAVVGAHLSGMPLHGDLLSRGAVLLDRTTTAAEYRLYALHGTTPPKPGLERVGPGGTAIEVEVYRLPLAEVGGFLASVVAPLAIGQVLLADGRSVHGFVCEPAALADAEDISDYGGWRAFRASLVQTGS